MTTFLLSFCLLWQDAVASDAGGSALTIPFLMIGLAIFYFFMIRPSIKEQQAQKDFASALKKGARVVTAGGLHGTIAAVESDHILLVIAPKTTIKVQQGYISSELTKSAYGENSKGAASPAKE